MNKTLTLPDAFALGLALPDVEQSVFFGMPALKVNGRAFAVTPGHKSAEPNSPALFAYLTKDELRAVLAEAHAFVSARASKKKRRER